MVLDRVMGVSFIELGEYVLLRAGGVGVTDPFILRLEDCICPLSGGGLGVLVG